MMASCLRVSGVIMCASRQVMYAASSKVAGIAGACATCACAVETRVRSAVAPVRIASFMMRSSYLLFWMAVPPR